MTKDSQTRPPTKGEQPESLPARETLTPQNRSASLPSPHEKRSATASPAAGSVYSVELHIEELVLNGFAAGDRRDIGDSFETEMNRLFTDNDVSPSLIRGGEIALLNDLEFDLAASASPESIGIQLARAVFRSLSHE